MAKTGTYRITRDDGVDQEVKGELVGEWWGIHKRDDSMYVLTHLPSGMLIWSSRKKTNLKMLLQEPEFFELPDHESVEWRAGIAKAIQRFCEKNTDLNHKPKKKVGWE